MSLMAEPAVALKKTLPCTVVPLAASSRYMPLLPQDALRVAQ